MKIAIIIILSIIELAIVSQWLPALNDNTFTQNLNYMGSIMMFLVVPLILVGFGLLIIKIANSNKPINLNDFLLFSLSLSFFTGCSFNPSNMVVVYTDDCGKSWKLVKTGDYVPHGNLNMCHRKYMIPNYVMQGASKYKVQFANRVNASVDMDYTYSILDPIVFMKGSRGIGVAKYDTESTREYIDSQFESMESILLEKRIKDICRQLLSKEDVVDFDSNFENIVFEKANKSLQEYGIRVESLDIIPTFGEQTTEAIDASTALRIYESKGLKQEGIEIIKARASSPKIVINQKDLDKPKE